MTFGTLTFGSSPAATAFNASRARVLSVHGLCGCTEIGDNGEVHVTKRVPICNTNTAPFAQSWRLERKSGQACSIIMPLDSLLLDHGVPSWAVDSFS